MSPPRGTGKLAAMMGDRSDTRRWWGLVALIVAAGLALRIAAAHGGLWLDEAVSAIQAQETGTALGVFLNINHDNNHHLNSLWLQFVGPGASPLAARALSIAAGTATILVAGILGRRGCPLLGLLTAAAFAFAPILVTLGSEARGYAPMLFALLLALLLTDRWLAGEARHSPATALALCCFLGALAQLTMIPGFCALAGWVVVALWRGDGPRPALVASLRLLLPSAIALAAVVAIIWRAAAASPAGFTFGAYDPFTWPMFGRGLSALVGYTFGVPAMGLTALALIPVLLVVAARAGVSRMPFHWLALAGFPLAVMIVQPGNVQFARYYLLVGLSLLILGAELASRGLAAGGTRRALALATLAIFAVGSTAGNIALLRNQRGDPAAAIAMLQARSPHGAIVVTERAQGRPVLRAAAAAAGYPLRIVTATCPAARFVFIDRFQDERFPAAVVLCGASYAPIAGARATGLSGTHWRLYERR